MRFSHPAAAHKEGHRPILELIAKRGNIYDLQTPHILHVTRDLLELCDWLASNEVTHVAMESTGVYWKPVWNILEANFTILLVNAQHVKAVPGRKTDAKDCQWIADLLQHGLLKGSFIPPSPIRELRDLTRTRASLRHAKDSRRRQCQIGVGSYRLVGRVRESYRERHVGR